MIITADGDYDFPVSASRDHTFFAGGTFGSGTVALKSVDSVGNVVAIADSVGAISYTSGNQCSFRTATNKVRVTLSGSTAASINILVVPAQL